MSFEQEGDPPQPWHALAPRAIATGLGLNGVDGLTSAQAKARLEKEGPNSLEKQRAEPLWQEALESLTEPLQLLLLAVAAVYFWFGETEDAVTILAVILVVASIEVSSELRAKRAIESLSRLGAPHASVLRDGRAVTLPGVDIVVGDIVLLSAGARVPADVRLVDSAGLRIDESALTGESSPVLKDAEDQLATELELGDRITMAYAGTLVTSGKGTGLVVGTGRGTEVGRIARLATSAREPRTPLQLALNQLAQWLLWVAIGFSVLVPALGVLLAGQPVRDMVLVGLTLAFATIPEELPILITIVLGLGAFSLSRRNGIVRKLRAAETLGSVSVVATDKTGTLTENKMRVAELFVDGGSVSFKNAASSLAAQKLLVVGALASEAQVIHDADGVRFTGDPTEVALLEAAQAAGLDPLKLRLDMKLVSEHPFTHDRNRMSALFERPGASLLAVKGSPESILAVCTSVRRASRCDTLDEPVRRLWLERAEAMATAGMRVLAVAERSESSGTTHGSAASLERDLVLLGLVGLLDPPRAEARQAVSDLQDAGVRVLMVTGDHPATASAIAHQVGIAAADEVVRGSELDKVDDAVFADLVQHKSVFARIAPEHKLRVVRALQARGEVVAVTGDGVNDAPALREAAVGVAMGKGGTDVAREAADLVLADDNFATVTEAVRTGRTLFANLRKAVRYYLAAKVALVSATLAAVLLKLPVPFEPVQIIVMELFMDLGASVTFVSEPAEDDVMRRPPRDPRAPFMDRSMVWGIVAGGLSLSAVVLCGYLGALQLGADVAHAQTAAFAAWMLGHVVLAAHMRAERQLLATSLLSNKAFLAWAASAVLLVVTATANPWLRNQLHMTTISPAMWLIVTGAALALPSWWEVWKLTRRGPRQTQGSSAASTV